MVLLKPNEGASKLSESWPLIDADEAVAMLQAGARGLDVRSSKECAHGALGPFVNVPILNDEHRHLVGLEYKQAGQEKAVELGFRLVSPLRAELVSRWRSELAELPVEKRLLMCWRGGLRSKIACDWLAESGFEGRRVQGGYKAIRGLLLKTFESLPPLLVLSGLTGAGKTQVLAGLPSGACIDLEGLARHRGSAFGLALRDQQPTQQTFENALGLALWTRETECLLEDEGALIGNCALPPPLRAKMLQAPLVILDSSVEERAVRIYAEYVELPLKSHPLGRVRQHLMDSLERISRRLGGKRTSEIRKLLMDAFAQAPNNLDAHRPWIEALLREYYDPAYEYGITRHQRNVIFRGGFREMQEFLADRFKAGPLR
jgi:tRNA 2-selenouridine synthase